MGLMRGMRRHYRKVEIVSGLLLIAVGILILTNSLQRLAFMFQGA
jgi:uncharacterized membrane protein HdeD (DUF308 family)